MQHQATAMCMSLAPMDLWRSRNLTLNTTMALGQQKGLGGRLEHGNSLPFCKQQCRAVCEGRALCTIFTTVECVMASRPVPSL